MADKGIEIEIKAILDEYSAETEKVAGRVAQEVAKEAVQKLKATSPKRSGEYAGGWKVTKKGNAYIVHNAKKPGLTHLLEKGHVIKNAKGTYGRAPAHTHIKPVEDWANQEFEDRLREELS